MLLLPPPLLLLPLLWAGGWAAGRRVGGAGAAADRCSSAGSLAWDREYRLEVPESVTVQEGLCVRVPCCFYYPWVKWDNSVPAFGYWFQERARPYQHRLVATNNPGRAVLTNTQGRFHLLGDPRTYSCSLDIRDARLGDTGTYFFRVEREPLVKYSYLENKLHLHVTGPGSVSLSSSALTQTPDIHVQGTLESGFPRNITCAVPWACERGTPHTFSWTGVTLPSLHPKGPHSSVLTLTLGPQDHGTKLTCRVNFPGAGVSTDRTIRLNVSYAPQKLTIRVFRKEDTALEAGTSELKAPADRVPGPESLGQSLSLPVQEGQFLRLDCVADSNPPARMSWIRGNLTLSPSNCSNPGVLELPRVQLGDHGKYVCRAQHPLGSKEASLSLIVKRRPAPRTGVVWGAVGGSGVTALLALCLCLIFFVVKIYRKKSAEKASGRDGVRPALTSISLGHLNESCSDSPSDYQTPAPATSTPGKEQELHYATLNFHRLRTHNFQDQDTTEYSEIKIQK
ncbi:sialic acid-binding Ig-like lectin 13 isoform X6 [Tursiops truncatus]|uniref:Myeloid cell surface antigen CD33-like isoform X6 n=1 Tax=Tursiops truncatus TaxID=9739 RepID=A0A6J3QGZ5_TURTR|nr:myeloid cell surface antigen CD33-like isoform X6 [Tursiops truncatus]